MIKPHDLDPTLMLHPGLNEIIFKANEHMETASKKLMIQRRKMGQTSCLFHTILNKFLDESTIVVMEKGTPTYPEKKYLGNVIINYLPEKHAWKITITNGGNKRKNAKTPIETRETFYLRRTDRIYWVDSSLSKDGRTEQ